jgi:hypothetical protein
MVKQLLIGLFLILPSRKKQLRTKQAFAETTIQQSICNMTFEEVIALAKQNQKN